MKRIKMISLAFFFLIIYISLKSMTISTNYKNLHRDYDDIITSINPESVNFYMQSLENFESRHAYNENRFEVAQWIADQFIEMGYTDVVLDSFYVEHYSQCTWQVNVICTLIGSETPQDFVILGAHYDSITFYDEIDIAPGADDNASGVAAILETARIIKENDYTPKSSIRFVAFAMEELGLKGSYYDANKISEQGMQVKAMINCDMIATATDPDWIYNIVYYPGNDILHDIAMEYGQNMSMDTRSIDYTLKGSDSQSYYDAGFPVLYFCEFEFSPHYHMATDLVENCNIPYATQFIRLISSVTLSIADAFNYDIEEFRLIDTGDGQSLKAEWNESENQEISYLLIVENLNTNEISEIFTSDDFFFINGLSENQEYKVKLHAVYQENLNIGHIRYETPKSIPRMVAGLEYQVNQDNIIFSWNANTELDIADYKVYRRITGDPDFYELANVDISQTNFIDITAEDKIWYDYAFTCSDLSGNESEPAYINKLRTLSLNQGICIIDFSSYSETNLLMPSKDAIDAFYQSVLSEYEYEEVIVNTDISIMDIGVYSTLLLHKSSISNQMYFHLFAILKDFIDMGGNLILTANNPVAFLNLLDTSYPFEINNNHPAYQYFFLEGVNKNIAPRFSRAVPQNTNLPMLEVETEKVPDQFNGKLFNMEVFWGENYENLYTYDSESDNQQQAAFDGMTVAFYTEKGNSKIMFTSIPLYFIKTNQVKDFINYILNRFNEETPNTDTAYTPNASLRLNNYPNPFNPITNITFNLPYDQSAQLTIYNIKGQIVKSFDKQYFTKGQNQHIWNGKDNHDKPVSSGIYIAKLIGANNVAKTRKMLLIK